MIWLLTIAIALIVIAVTVLVVRWRNPVMAPHRLTLGARRILFPFLGESVSQSALDAVLRLARADDATLVPVYIATVPYHLALNAPIPGKCGQAMPLLEAIEQRATRADVPVDSRIETGRTPRHALRLMLDHEQCDRLVVPAATRTSAGFSTEDIAWLLEQAPGEILVLRPVQTRTKMVASVRSVRRRGTHPRPKLQISRRYSPTQGRTADGAGETPPIGASAPVRL